MGLILIKFYYLAEERSGWLSHVASSIKTAGGGRREEGGHRISSLSLPVGRNSVHGKEVDTETFKPSKIDISGYITVNSAVYGVSG